MSYVERCRKLLAEGRCVDCKGKKERARRNKRQCVRCAQRHTAYKRRHNAHLKPIASRFAATIACLKCGEKFRSPNRRTIRRCDECHWKQSATCSQYDIEAALYDV